MRRRDSLDASRHVAPMTPAADAVEIFTDHLATEDVIARIVALAQARGMGPAADRAIDVATDVAGQ
jgi:cytidylate kinase